MTKCRCRHGRPWFAFCIFCHDYEIFQGRTDKISHDPNGAGINIHYSFRNDFFNPPGVVPRQSFTGSTIH